MVAGEGSQGGSTRRRQKLLTTRETAVAERRVRERTGATPTAPPTPMPDPLALAFLALADDDTVPDQRTRPRVLTAAVTAVVLAIAAPAGFVFAGHSDQPVAALSSKFSLSHDDD
jgi:hypothetical protein